MLFQKEVQTLQQVPVTRVIDFRQDFELQGPLGLSDTDIATLRERYLK